MNINIKLAMDDAEKIVGDHILKKFGLQDAYDADVSLDRYSGVEVKLIPKETEAAE